MERVRVADGAEIAVEELGSGLPLVCLHGGMGVDSRSLAVPGVLDLAARGIRLILPDQRGHGRSSAPSEASYTHERWAADVVEVAGALGLPHCALLGHSYGGFIALEVAVRRPELVSHLVLVASSAGPVPASGTTFASDGALAEHFRDVWPLFFHGTEKHWELFRAITFSAAPHAAAFARELPRYDLRQEIPEVDVPMLLVVGSEDPYLPHMEWLAENAPRAELRVLDGAGHFPFVEAPTAFTGAVASFLLGEAPAAAAR